MTIDKLKLGTRCQLKGIRYEVTEINQNIARLNSIGSKREVFLRIEQVDDLISSADLSIESNIPSDWGLIALTDSKRKTRHHRMLFYCSEAYRCFGARLPIKPLRAFIQKTAVKLDDKSPPCLRTVQYWFKDYLQGGMAPSSLLRKTDRPGFRARKIDEFVVELMNMYLQDEYLGTERMSLTFAYELFSNHLLNENQNRQQQGLELFKIPSYETFRLEKNKIGPKIIMEKRLGKYTAQKSFKYGGTLRPASRIGERVESDSNYMDILLVDSLMQVIGRPYLCALMDIHTRCIIGWEISFCPPSAAKTLRALRNAITSESLSPYKCIPDELILDNGPEFTNGSLETVSFNFNISLRYVAPRQPDEKAHIERFFRTMNEQLIHLLPGTTFSNTQQRGEYNAEKNAVLTIDQLTEYFRDWLENVYHKSVHRMLNATPDNFWQKSIATWKPVTAPKEEVDKLCRRVVKRKLIGGRVRFDNLFWFGPSLPVFQHQLKKNEMVNVFIDETDLGTVWVQSPIDPHTVVQADALDPEFQKGLSMYEYQLIKEQLSGLAPEKQTTQEKLQAQVNLRNKIKADTKAARKTKALIESHKRKANSAQSSPDASTTFEPPVSDNRPAAPSHPSHETEDMIEGELAFEVVRTLI